MSNLVESFKKFIAETPKEELKKIWESGDYLDNGGLKVTEYIELVKERHPDLVERLDKIITTIDHEIQEIINKNFEDLL